MTRIHYIYHSCFVVEDDHSLVVFDYWKDPFGRLLPLIDGTSKALYFVVSHFHHDHYNPIIWNFPGAHVLVSYDTVKHHHVDRALPAAILRPGHGFSDANIELSCYRSSDIGVCSALRLPDGTVCFHMGDCNNWYFPDDHGEQLKITPLQMEKLFLSIIRDVAADISQVDHLMFPVDPRLGPHTLRGLDQWLAKIPARHIYPMHYWDRPNEVRTLLLGRPNAVLSNL